MINKKIIILINLLMLAYVFSIVFSVPLSPFATGLCLTLLIIHSVSCMVFFFIHVFVWRSLTEIIRVKNSSADITEELIEKTKQLFEKYLNAEGASGFFDTISRWLFTLLGFSMLATTLWPFGLVISSTVLLRTRTFNMMVDFLEKENKKV